MIPDLRSSIGKNLCFNFLKNAAFTGIALTLPLITYSVFTHCISPYVNRSIFMSQKSCPDQHKSEANLANIPCSEPFRIETHDQPIQGRIFYPPNYNPKISKSCSVYFNASDTVVARHFYNKEIRGVPAAISRISKDPVILWDFRGTGLSKPQDKTLTPTISSAISEGEAVLNFALEKFKSAYVVGSCLGGAIATLSLDRHLEKNPQNTSKIRGLINHDSFTLSSRMNWPFMASIKSPLACYITNHPRFRWITDFIITLAGAQIDARVPMKKLIHRNIPILILAHRDDDIIWKGGRMSEYVAALPPKSNVRIIETPGDAHARICSPMAQSITPFLQPLPQSRL